jgi:hypothetical protein
LGKWGEMEKVGKNKGINPFFPCLCVCKGRRRTMLFKMTLFQRFFFLGWKKIEFGG